MKKLALLACSMLFVSSVACAAVDATVASQAQATAAAGGSSFTVAGVAYGIVVAAGVITITQGTGTGSTVIGTVGPR